MPENKARCKPSLNRGAEERSTTPRSGIGSNNRGADDVRATKKPPEGSSIDATKGSVAQDVSNIQKGNNLTGSSQEAAKGSDAPQSTAKHSASSPPNSSSIDASKAALKQAISNIWNLKDKPLEQAIQALEIDQLT